MYFQAPWAFFAYFSIFCLFSATFQTVNSQHDTSIVNIGAKHHPCGGGQVAKDPVPGHGGGPRCWQGEPTSSANYESSSGQILSSLQTVSQSAG